MKRFSLVIALLLATQFMFAQNTSTTVTAKEAMNYGLSYIKAQYPSRAAFNVSSYELLKSETTGKDCFHVFNFENGGFAIVSADRRGIPVLGYSDEGEFIFSEGSLSSQNWIRQYMQQLDIIEANDQPLTDANIAAWDQTVTRSNVRGVEKLVETKWNQGYPYNMECPLHPQGDGGHTYTGCVATAMAQVMKYWNYPESGTGELTYFWGGWDTINLAETTYRWDLMPNEFRFNSTMEEKEAVAILMFHVGVSINMDYGYEASGTQTEYTASALRYNFGYRNGVNYKQRDNGATTEDSFEHYFGNDTIWCRMIMEELDMHRPLIYSGHSKSSGHAWVCDGYRTDSDGSTKFHMNWGWGGYHDGWFAIDNLLTTATAAGDENNFMYGQGAVFGIAVPDNNVAPYCMQNQHNVYEEEYWNINDGSYANYYKENTSCDWVIKINDYATDTLLYYFNYFDLGAGDELKIYAGEDANGQLLKTYFDSNAPGDSVFKYVGTPLYIHFTSDDADQARGWELHYEALRYPFTITTTMNGVGYNDTLPISPLPINMPDTVVTPLPVMKNATVTVNMYAKTGYTVTEFVVDGLLKITGSGQDTIMGYTFSNIKANHTIDVTFGPAAVDENNSDNISIYPNPNNGKFSVNFGDINAESYAIYDMSGRIIEEKALNGDNTADFNMNLAAGTYFIRIVSNDKVNVEKIVIE